MCSGVYCHGLSYHGYFHGSLCCIIDFQWTEVSSSKKEWLCTWLLYWECKLKHIPCQYRRNLLIVIFRSVLNALSARKCTSRCLRGYHYDDVIMSEIASQITSLAIVYSTVLSGADQSKHQSSASLAFVWEIHRWPVNFPHKWPVTRKIFPFDDVIMAWQVGLVESIPVTWLKTIHLTDRKSVFDNHRDRIKMQSEIKTCHNLERMPNP